MLSYLKDFFTQNNEENFKDLKSRNHKLQIAACSLLLEIAQADDDFSIIEKNRIIEIMKDIFNLSDSEIDVLINKSEDQIENSVSMYEFTEVLNQNLSAEEKYALVKYLWHIAYADGNLDSYEDYYIKKVSNNLHIYNKDRIAAKIEVKKELDL